jgi:hypothetical protein
VEVLEVRKRALGLEHPDNLMSMINLASTYSRQGKSNEAEALQMEVLEGWKRIQGPQHPNTLTSTDNPKRRRFGGEEPGESDEERRTEGKKVRPYHRADCPSGRPASLFGRHSVQIFPPRSAPLTTKLQHVAMSASSDNFRTDLSIFAPFTVDTSWEFHSWLHAQERRVSDQ